jgi:hypothetical protein
MRVRHKWGQLPGEHEVLEESENFYILTDYCLLRKRDYEPIPTETWRDVTGECEFSCPQDCHISLWHSIGAGRYDVIARINNGNDLYRLRKVQLMQPEGATVKEGGIFGTQFLIKEAFIVEKRDA